MSTHIAADRIGIKVHTPIDRPEFLFIIRFDSNTVVEVNLAKYVVEQDPTWVAEANPTVDNAPRMISYFHVPPETLNVFFNVIEEACRFAPGETYQNLAKFLANALGERAYKMGQWITEAASDK